MTRSMLKNGSEILKRWLYYANDPISKKWHMQNVFFVVRRSYLSITRDARRHGKKLRRALIDEFEDIVDSHAVHQELLRRKKTSDESYQAYIYNTYCLRLLRKPMSIHHQSLNILSREFKMIRLARQYCNARSKNNT